MSPSFDSFTDLSEILKDATPDRTLQEGSKLIGPAVQALRCSPAPRTYRTDASAVSPWPVVPFRSNAAAGSAQMNRINPWCRSKLRPLRPLKATYGRTATVH